VLRPSFGETHLQPRAAYEHPAAANPILAAARNVIGRARTFRAVRTSIRKCPRCKAELLAG